MVTQDISIAASTLLRGGVVAFPTETVYGLGAAIGFPEAVTRVYTLKGRPLNHPLIVHVSNWKMVERVAKEIPEKARLLMESFWPGPLTVILPKQDQVSKVVTGGLDSVGIRWPSHPTALALIEASGMPVAAPSANPFGSVSPTRASHVEESLPGADCILEGGKSEVGVESTIVSFLEGEPVLLRPGGIPLSEIEKVIGKTRVASSESPSIAPGMLPKHYSTRTPIALVEKAEVREPFLKWGLLCFGPIPPEGGFQTAVSLSLEKNLPEAASRLYDELRNMDRLGLDRIVVEKFPEEGLGITINDRLVRASFPTKGH